MIKRKIIFPIIAGFLVLILSASAVINHRGAIACSGSPVDGTTCGLCHGGGTVTPTISVTTNPSLGSGDTYSPGQLYTVNINLSGIYPAYGFNCEIIDSQSSNTSSVSTFGTFGSPVTSNCQIYPFTTTTPFPVCASHNSASGSGNAATVSFVWTAPAFGTGYLYCVGLGVNNNGNENGDKISAVKSMTLTPVANEIFSYSEDHVELSVFPNPAKDILRIAFSIKERSSVSIRLCNLNGEFVSDLYSGIQNSGRQNLELHLPQELPKGIYVVKLNVNDKQTAQKLLVY